MRRRTFLVALAGLMSACAGPVPAVEPTVTIAPTAPPEPRSATPVPTQPAPTARPTQPPPTATLVPAPTATPEPARVELDVRLWNGSAVVHIDGRTIEPG